MLATDDLCLTKGISAQTFKQKMREVTSNPPWLTSKQIKQARWDPYSIEGGSTLAIAGEDFVVAAGDTRMSQFEVNILTRNGEKVHPLSDKIVLTTSGFHGDVLQLKRVMDAHLRKFRFDYREEMSVDMCSELLSRTFYYKRFFPYYTGAVLCGIDEFGKGALYSYDPIGTLERCPYQASGAGLLIIQSYLDHQIAHNTLAPGMPRPELTIERAIAIAKDAFRLTAERETTTGDSVTFVVLQNGKPAQKFCMLLRED